MSTNPVDVPDVSDLPGSASRRALLQCAAGVVISQLAVDVGHAAPASASAGSGKKGQFDFLEGRWRIAHRRLKGAEWDTFAGEATCWTILNGAASIEELRIPARDFYGMGIRLLETESKTWMDYWVSARDCVLSTPGMAGSFVGGAGIFEAEDKDGDQPIKVRGVWDRITPTSCRWHQAVSRDGGKSFEPNWFMDWTRS